MSLKYTSARLPALPLRLVVTLNPVQMGVSLDHKYLRIGLLVWYSLYHQANNLP